MHTRISICIRAGTAKIFAFGDPRLHNEIVRILGATYMSFSHLSNNQAYSNALSPCPDNHHHLTTAMPAGVPRLVTPYARASNCLFSNYAA